MIFDKLKKEINLHSDKNRAKTNAWFFKTGKGEYGEGDVFLGLTMPEQRKISKGFKDLSLTDVTKLISSKYHEERMIALLILVQKYELGNKRIKKQIYNFYIKHRSRVNNWDLIDVTTPNIVGDYLKKKDKKILYTFARSKSLWERRMAILSTYTFIKHGMLQDTLNISKILLSDEEDLIHKAVGWMLREVGKVDQSKLESFLRKNVRQIPRTTMRYAIERFPEKKRKAYLKK